MLYKFKSKAGGDVIMTAPVGDAVLRAMGRAPAPQGILEASSLASLKRTLETSIADDAASRALRTDPISSNAAPSPELGNAADRSPSLQQRAWPLLGLMQRSLDAGESIVWGV